MKDTTVQMERPYRLGGTTPAAGIAAGGPGVADARTGSPGAERLRPRVPARRRPASGMTPVPGWPATASRPACARTRDVGYRLSRWARLTITLSVLAVGLMFATGALPAGSTAVAPGTGQIVVHAGDTLESVADAHSTDPGGPGDLLVVMQRIRHLNGLEGLASDAVLPTGLVLMVPMVTSSG